MKAMKTIAMLLAVGMFLAVGTSANAGSIGVNFASNQRAMASTETAGVDVQHANWNNAPDATGSTANITGPVAGKLSDDSGVDSGVTVTWTKNSTNSTWKQTVGGTGGDAKMMYGYIDNGNTASPGTTLSFANLNQFASAYDVYVYAASDHTNGLVTISKLRDQRRAHQRFDVPG